ncbi:efflux RND transporter periplasmic adaptor subunit [Hydrogenivirga sp.]
MTRQSVLPLILLLALLFSCGGEKKEAGRKERVFNVKTQAVEQGEFYIKFRTSGYFEPVHRVLIRPEVSGRVVRLYAEEGDRVGEGAPLLKIEDSLYRKSYEETLWKLEQAKRQLLKVKAVYERRKRLFEKELISREEFEEVRTEFDVLEAQIESLKALLARKKVELDRTLLRSPLKGYVLRRLVDVGDYLTPQREAYELVRLSPLRLVFSVPQEVVGTLKLGKPVRIKTEGLNLTAEVSYVSPSADRSRMFTVKALLPNPQGSIKPNSYAEVSFDYKRVRAVSVPEQAVQLSQRQSFVWVMRESRAVKLPVEVVAHEEGRVLIRGEFRGGDRVIVEGTLFLYEGAKVSER